ncbi:CTP synthetase [Halobacteriales archaeon QS_5_70_17]|nr:MAG: CTP synthetase [Halobacteriales archaeon QS_5_70_17]
MTRAIVVGSDPNGIGEALADRGVEVARATGTGDREALTDAGVEGADLLVVTDAGLATSIPVARELTPDIKVVAYTGNSLPEFALASAALIVDPDLMSPETVAEELA